MTSIITREVIPRKEEQPSVPQRRSLARITTDANEQSTGNQTLRAVDGIIKLDF
jgi:hypothetical protein